MRTTFLLLLLAAGSAFAQTGTPEIEVERAKAPKVRSLGFLRENQAFLRAQLDHLRTRTQWRESKADELTTRQEWLRGLALELDAAEDSLARERAAIEQRTLLERIEELAAIEAQLDRLEQLLDAQHERLAAIERDYVGRQETALAVLARGLPVDDARALIVRTLDGDPVRVDLDATTREALREGAVATLLHDFVEPRAHDLLVLAERGDGSEIEIGRVAVRTTRDRLTFVEIDLGRRGDDGTLTTVSWLR